MEGLTVDGVLIAVAAIGAAAIAARTANHRMERQLAEERERLRMNLRHDRRMRDREELRRTLDEAASALADGAEELHEALTTARRSSGPDGEGTFAEVRRGLHHKIYAAFIQSERLKFRFADDDGIPNEFERAYTRLHDASKLLRDADEDDLKKGDELLDEAVSAYLEFARLCRPHVEVAAPEPSG